MSSTGEGNARRNVACPSCGAPVRFRGATSIVAVCPYCKATLVREGVNLENIGKQAELLEDHTPIRIGAEGYHRGEGFTVVGRIQFKYEAGVWNEWYVLFRGSKGAWLSDASREYSISYLVPPQPVPAFETLQPQHQVVLSGDKSVAGGYVVTNLDEGEVVAGEGELPFKFTAGWKAKVADMRGNGTRFATIDYSESPPHIYVGEKLPFDAFRFTGLRDPEQVAFTKGTALAFKCGGCGAPIEKHLATTEVVACGSCGTVTDVTTPVAQVVQKNERNMKLHQPLIPLGTVGSWQGVRYEVVGFMRRGVVVDGVLYEWAEYLLHNIERGYAWITEYDGHFNFVRAAAEIPKKKPFKAGKPVVTYLGRRFLHFQKAKAKVTYLNGEFYWRVKIGEENVCEDYVAPPLVLSAEYTGKEVNWSLGEYTPAPALWKAFNLKTEPPRPRGVASNQPSPYTGGVKRFWAAFAIFLVVALLTQFGFWALQPSKNAAVLAFSAGGKDVARAVSPVFRLGGMGGNAVTLRVESDATQDWLALDMQLTNADSGNAYAVKRQLGFHNVGGVREGSRIDVAEIPGVPPGRYTLAVDARAPQPAQGTVQVYRSGIGWSNFWIFAVFIFLWPVIALVRSGMFESRRWAESDYGSSASLEALATSDAVEAPEKEGQEPGKAKGDKDKSGKKR